MWIVAGVLLGLVALMTLAGFHLGPHSHLIAGVLGAAAAALLLVMALSGAGDDVLYLLLGADLALSAGVGTLAYKGLTGKARAELHRPGRGLEGLAGVAVSDIDPGGVVRIGGETWSATTSGGRIPAGTPVEVLRAGGVRLEVVAAGSIDPLGLAAAAGGQLFRLADRPLVDRPLDKAMPDGASAVRSSGIDAAPMVGAGADLVGGHAPSAVPNPGSERPGAHRAVPPGEPEQGAGGSWAGPTSRAQGAAGGMDRS